MPDRKCFIKKNIIKISHWLWFGLSLSLLPLGFVAWRITGTSSYTSVDVIEKVISHGELLLICISTLGAAIGELASKETTWIIVRIWLTGIALLLALFATSSYTEIATSYIGTSNQISIKYIYTTSLNVFYATLSVTISSLILPSREKENV